MLVPERRSMGVEASSHGFAVTKYFIRCYIKIFIIILVTAPELVKGVIFMSKNKSTKILVQCALFLAMALVLRNFSYMVFMGGGSGMRLGVSGFFSKMPAILFGPMYGAAVSGLTDLFGYVLKPDGAYIFPVTLTAALGGAMSGLIFRFAKKRSVQTIQKLYAGVVIAVAAFGAVNHICIVKFPECMWTQILIGLKSKTVYFTYGLYVVAILGTVFFIINMVLQKKFKASFMNEYMRLFVTFLIADVTVTTLNTFILIWFIPALANLPFMTFFLPRLAQEIVAVFMHSFVIAYLYDVFKRFNKIEQN